MKDLRKRGHQRPDNGQIPERIVKSVPPRDHNDPLTYLKDGKPSTLGRKVSPCPLSTEVHLSTTRLEVVSVFPKRYGGPRYWVSADSSEILDS